MKQLCAGAPSMGVAGVHASGFAELTLRHSRALLLPTRVRAAGRARDTPRPACLLHGLRAYQRRRGEHACTEYNV